MSKVVRVEKEEDDILPVSTIKLILKNGAPCFVSLPSIKWTTPSSNIIILDSY